MDTECKVCMHAPKVKHQVVQVVLYFQSDFCGPFLLVLLVRQLAVAFVCALWAPLCVCWLCLEHYGNDQDVPNMLHLFHPGVCVCVCDCVCVCVCVYLCLRFSVCCWYASSWESSVTPALITCITDG